MEYTNTIKVLNEFADYLINNYKTELASQGWSGGKLYNSVKKVSVVVGDVSTVTLSLEDYWKYIENGRRAGAKMPPITAIKNWIERKNIIPRPMTLRNGKTVVPNTKSLAFLIARSISKKGIKPKPLLKKSLELSKNNFIDKIKEALTNDIIQNVFNDEKERS